MSAPDVPALHKVAVDVGLDADAMYLLHTEKMRTKGNLAFLHEALNEGRRRYFTDPVFHAQAFLVRQFLSSGGLPTHEANGIAIALLLERFDREMNS